VIKEVLINILAVCKNKRSILRRLYKQQAGKCCYCKKNTKLPVSGDSITGDAENSASIEHVYSKWDIRRYAQKGDHQFVKMSCRKCNQERQAIEQKLLSNSKNVLKGIILDIRLPFHRWPFPMKKYKFPNFNL
jgi:hypothetical protein